MVVLKQHKFLSDNKSIHYQQQTCRLVINSTPCYAYSRHNGTYSFRKRPPRENLFRDGKLDAFVVKVAKEPENTDTVNRMLLSIAICQGA